MNLKRRKRQLQSLGLIDKKTEGEIDKLLSPPIVWRFRTKNKSEFSRIVSMSAKKTMRERKNNRSVTAAVSQLSLDGASWKSFKFGDRAWQSDAWRLYDITGQLRFVSNWIGNSVSRCELVVAKVNPNGSIGERVETGEIAELAAGPLGVGNAKAEALRLLGIDLFVSGEAYIVAESGAGPDNADLWWVVTSRQIKKRGDSITIPRPQMYGGGSVEYRDGIDLILRTWTPHPADTTEPDSPTRSAIPDLREMEALRKREFAELDSRLTGAGLLALPESLELPRGDDDPIGAAGFSALLGRIMSRSLSDRSSAEAMVPIIITGPGEDIDQIKHITMWSELSEKISDMRDGALRSLAQSLDIPPEVLIGLGSSTNHWNAWAISREAVQIHIKPILSRIAEALTTGFLAPALEAIGENPHAYVYAFDTSALTVNPDRSTDAKDLHDRMLISDEVARSASAWSIKDAPSEKERAIRLTEKLLFTSPDAVLSDPTLRALIGLPEIPETYATPSVDSNPTIEPAKPTENVDSEKPPDEPNSPTAPVESTPTGLSYVAHLATRRALSLAGTRLIPHSRRPSGISSHQLHVHYGPVRDASVIDACLRGQWRNEFSDIKNEFGIDNEAFIGIVEEHCKTLLERGIAHTQEDITALFNSPTVIKRLAAAHDG